MAKLFISYARSTAPQAQLIAERLREAGHAVWMDDQLLAHRAFSDAIEEQLKVSDAVMVAWSADAVRSEWVRAEADRARLAGKLVQVMLEPCPLPLPFDQIHCVELFSWTGDYEAPSWRTVLASVAAATGQATASPPGGRSQRAATDSQGERRQLTVLYCDLVDAGALSARLDPEDMMEVLDVYHATCEDVLAHHGGTIVKAGGHGHLAYFGYPRGDEEQAANAVRAGLALCEAVGRLELPAQMKLQARVGVATGLVVVSDVVGRSGVRETEVVGETPNLAARLQALAPPGGVIISEVTRRITEGLFTFRDLGDEPLPGHDAPAPRFEAIAATELSSRSQARGQSEATALLGRDAELALLKECWTLASRGEGQVVLLQGDAGIGKSRLMETFRKGLADPHSQSTWFCAPNYSDSALHPVLDQLQRAAAFERDDPVEARREKLGELLERCGASGAERSLVIADLLGLSSPEAGALTPDRRKGVALETLLAMMDGIARSSPALFVVEDLHWADATTLGLLEQAIRRTSDRSWMILATARPEFESRWEDYSDVVHIPLARLDKADAAQICAQLGAEALLPPETVRQIVARCDGNPLFVEEMTKAVLEATAIASNKAGPAPVAIPTTLQDSLAARLDRLGSAKAVACLAAAIGRDFSYELLAAVSPLPPADLRQALRELGLAGVIERKGVPPNSRYLFRHALIRDAAYEGLLKRERQALHGRIAQALREKFPYTLETEPALVAYHFTESGAVAEAVPLWAAAGQRAMAQAAHVEAVSHMRTALELLRRQPLDDARLGFEVQLLIALTVSLAASRGYSIPEVADLLSESMAICDRLGNVPSLYLILQTICSFSMNASDLPAAEAALRRCLEISEQSGRSEDRICYETAIGHLETMRGRFQEARRHCEIAASMLKKHGNEEMVYPNIPGAMIGMLATMPLIHCALGDEAAERRASTELFNELAARGEGFEMAYGLSWHSACDIIGGRYGQALENTERALKICREKGYDTFANAASILQACALGRRGDLEAAREMVGRGIDQHRKLGVKSMLSFMLAEFAELHALAGDYEAALATVDEAIAHAVEFDDCYYLSPAHRIRAEILRKMPGSDPADIKAAVSMALAVAEEQGATGFAAAVALQTADTGA